jgi:hypothetical protein
MSYEAVQWAIHKAPLLLMPGGGPDVAARLILIVRAERADKHGKGTYAGHAEITRVTGYDVRTIQRAERRLEKAGLMIRRGMTHLGTPHWDLDLTVESTVGADYAAERDARRREQTAARVRRHRAKQAGADIEVDVSTGQPVTTPEVVSNGTGQRYVTTRDAVCNAPHATRTTNEPPRETTTETTLGGAPPPNPRRHPSPSAPGTYSHTSLAEPLTQAQDQASDPLPHARAIAPVVEIRPGASQEARYRPPPTWTTGSMSEVEAATARRRARIAEYQAQLTAEKEAT